MLCISQHAAQRLRQRGISEREARRAVTHGRVTDERLGGLRVSHGDVTVVLSITADGREATIITAWRTTA